MALDVSGSQIYAGRYHYRRSEMPDLFREDIVQSRREKKSIKEQYSVDTVTFSEKGMAKAKAKDWRAYTIDNPDISHVNIKEQREELYRQLNTVNKIDTASMFNLELGEVASQIQKENGGGEHAGSHEAFLTVMAKAYQIIYDRIEEDFADPDRDTTWVLKEDGTYVEETKQDRINALNKAYHSRAEIAAAAAKQQVVIENTFRGKDYSTDFMNELQNKLKESWQNAIDEKNMERLRRKVTSFQDYSLNMGIGSSWSEMINALLYR